MSEGNKSIRCKEGYKMATEIDKSDPRYRDDDRSFLEQPVRFVGKKNNFVIGLRGIIQSTTLQAFCAFLFAVLAAVYFFFFVCQYKDMRQFLFNGSDTSGVLTADHIANHFREL